MDEPADTTTTYSLEEAAEIICGASGSAEVHWLAQRLRGAARPTLPGYKAQRHWRMTHADIDQAIELLRPTRRDTDEPHPVLIGHYVDSKKDRRHYHQGLRLPSLSSLTPTSRRRLFRE